LSGEAALRGEQAALGDREAAGRDIQAGMMVEAAVRAADQPVHDSEWFRCGGIDPEGRAALRMGLQVTAGGGDGVRPVEGQPGQGCGRGGGLPWRASTACASALCCVE
jgi:hypothetical protein